MNGIGFANRCTFATVFTFVGINALGRSQTVLSNVRHIQAIKDAKGHLIEALDTIQYHMPIDLVASDIKNAWHALGEVTGDTVDEDSVERIFSKFCVGK